MAMLDGMFYVEVAVVECDGRSCKFVGGLLTVCRPLLLTTLSLLQVCSCFLLPHSNGWEGYTR